MHGHRTTKSILRFIFIFSQLLFLTIGTFLTIATLSLYFKLMNIFLIPYTKLSLLLFHHSFFIKISLMGLHALKENNKYTNTIYIILVLFLINIQVVFSFCFAKNDNAQDYVKNLFDRMNETQRLYLTNSLKCDGFESGSKVMCGEVVEKLYRVLRDMVFKFVIVMVLLESGAIICLMILKMKNKKKK